MSTENIKNEKAAEEYRLRCLDIERFVARGFALNCSLRDHHYAILSILDVIWGGEDTGRAAELALIARNEVLKHSPALLDEAVERLVGERLSEVNA